MNRVFIGYDEVESIAWHVCAHSVMRNASDPVSIIPVMEEKLPMDRPRDEHQSNSFAFARFLVPWLCDYRGWALFMDCDMLVRCDVQEIFDLADDRYAVQVVKHDYVPVTKRKYLGHTQYKYPRKNWSSVMLMNCERCLALSPEFINTSTGLALHRFLWLSDAEIGELPIAYNHLVTEYQPNPEARIAHFTIGGPWFPEFKGCEFAGDWFDELAMMEHVQL